MKQSTSAWILVAAAATFVASVAVAQSAGQAPPPTPPIFPAEMKNRQVLPPSTGGAQLGVIMKDFSRSLGVRCTFCHTGTEEMPLWQRDFASDANPRKETARAMIRMVQHLNQERLPAIPGLQSPRVTCYTCHRGSIKPATDLPPTPRAPPAASQTERG